MSTISREPGKQKMHKTQTSMQIRSACPQLDPGLNRKFAEKFSICFIAHNLPNDHHLEFGQPADCLNSSYIKRSACVKFT